MILSYPAGPGNSSCTGSVCPAGSAGQPGAGKIIFHCQIIAQLFPKRFHHGKSRKKHTHEPGCCVQQAQYARQHGHATGQELRARLLFIASWHGCHCLYNPWSFYLTFQSSYLIILWIVRFHHPNSPILILTFIHPSIKCPQPSPQVLVRFSKLTCLWL